MSDGWSQVPKKKRQQKPQASASQPQLSQVVGNTWASLGGHAKSKTALKNANRAARRREAAEERARLERAGVVASGQGQGGSGHGGQGAGNSEWEGLEEALRLSELEAKNSRPVAEQRSQPVQQKPVVPTSAPAPRPMVTKSAPPTADSVGPAWGTPAPKAAPAPAPQPAPQQDAWVTVPKKDKLGASPPQVPMTKAAKKNAKRKAKRERERLEQLQREGGGAVQQPPQQQQQQPQQSQVQEEVQPIAATLAPAPIPSSHAAPRVVEADTTEAPQPVAPTPSNPPTSVWGKPAAQPRAQPEPQAPPAVVEKPQYVPDSSANVQAAPVHQSPPRGPAVASQPEPILAPVAAPVEPVAPEPVPQVQDQFWDNAPAANNFNGAPQFPPENNAAFDHQALESQRLLAELQSKKEAMAAELARQTEILNLQRATLELQQQQERVQAQLNQLNTSSGNTPAPAPAAYSPFGQPPGYGAPMMNGNNMNGGNMNGGNMNGSGHVAPPPGVGLDNGYGHPPMMQQQQQQPMQPQQGFNSYQQPMPEYSNGGHTANWDANDHSKVPAGSRPYNPNQSNGWDYNDQASPANKTLAGWEEAERSMEHLVGTAHNSYVPPHRR